MANYYGKRMSRRWKTVLDEADRQGLRFHVTSGRRTIAEQWRLYNAYRAGRGNLAAYPSPTAPHIRVGRADHAVDVNALDGGAQRLANWLRQNGVHAVFPVPGEPWHIEVRGGLRAFAKRIRKQQRRKARR